jgi:hypothetical protein
VYGSTIRQSVPRHFESNRPVAIQVIPQVFASASETARWFAAERCFQANNEIGPFPMLCQTLRIPISIAAMVFSASSVLVYCGCGANRASPAGDRELRAAMTLLGREYGGYLAEKGAAPPNEEALRLYLQSRLVNLADYGVKSADDLVRAGRDGQPLKVIVGRKAPTLERPEYVWAAYEQSGVAGTRLACDSRGGVYEFTDEEFSKQFAGG